MKILIAIGVPRQEEAGAAGVVFNHTRELKKRGHSVDCWFLDDVIKKPVVPRRLEALIFATRVARRILGERDRYDVVNLHAPWGCIYGLERKLFRPSGVPPYVLTMQGSEERYAQMMRPEHNKGRAKNFAWHNRIWHGLYHQNMYRWSIRTADYGAIANREGTIYAEACRRRVSGTFCFVPNGVEESFFTHRKYSEKLPVTLLYVGSWLDRKGIYYLAESFLLLASSIPGIRLTVTGCLTSEERVKKFFAPEVRAQVCVVPFFERKRMPAIYAEHEIFVFPSLVEGMPLTLLEAMASGMPVVTTNVCGMADVVEDGRNGLLVPAADAESIAKAVERLCRCPELRRQLGEEAQRTMRSYTWEKVTRQLEELLTLAVKQGAKN
ncbi:MAG TPA: glycosyltransferase family 4 protein [Candidatus Acidoferrales bacterium]|nr:glycosyltransferase family 4 protein [Candidatus Acidoferrales bacterium]